MKRIVILMVSLMTLCFSCRDTPKHTEECTSVQQEIQVPPEIIKEAILSGEQQRLKLQLQQCSGVRSISLDSVTLFQSHSMQMNGMLHTTWHYKNFLNNKMYTESIAVVISDINVNTLYKEVTWRTEWNHARNLIILKQTE